MFETVVGGAASVAVLSSAALTALRGALAVDAGELSPGERVDRIRELEELRSAVAAAQAVQAAAFVTERREQAEAAAKTRTTGVGRRPLSRATQLRQAERSAQSEVALARRVSPQQGSAYAGFAIILTTELPCTFAALQAGRLSEWRARIVAKETIWLSAQHRAQVDTDIAPDLEKLGDARLQAAVRAMAYRLDPEGFVQRSRLAHGDRRVSVRTAPDTMAYLTALLPLVDAVAVNKALTQVADRRRAEGDERSHEQLKADVLVDLVLGRTTAGELGVAVEIELLMSSDTLFGTGPDADEPGWLDGHPLPAPIARDLALGTDTEASDQVDADSDTPDDSAVAGTANQAGDTGIATAEPSAAGPVPSFPDPTPTTTADPATAERGVGRSIRRLFADPDTGELVAMESRRRQFTPAQRRFIRLRDQGTCRTPWCNAPIRHTDHANPAETQGKTSVANGQGLCENCNYAKQAPGWTATPLDTGAAPDILITTPTGHNYRSQAPPPPGGRRSTIPVEIRLARLLVDFQYAA
jgi:hypothetical protein